MLRRCLGKLAICDQGHGDALSRTYRSARLRPAGIRVRVREHSRWTPRSQRDEQGVGSANGPGGTV